MEFYKTGSHSMCEIAQKSGLLGHKPSKCVNGRPAAMSRIEVHSKGVEIVSGSEYSFC